MHEESALLSLVVEDCDLVDELDPRSAFKL